MTSDPAALLREKQAPLKQQYRDDPQSAVVTLIADGELDGTGVACRVRTASALAEAGLHPATGGDGTQLCSGDMLLEALVACAGVTLRAVATSLRLDVTGTVHAEGDLDFRGTLGVDKQAPVGFRDIRLTFDLTTDADADQLATPGQADRAVLRRPADDPPVADDLGARDGGTAVNGAHSLLATLVDAGVDVCFANPGTSEMHFVAALDGVPALRPVLTLFEGVATGAADGYARMAGRPAAVLLHLGPGPRQRPRQPAQRPPGRLGRS